MTRPAIFTVLFALAALAPTAVAQDFGGVQNPDNYPPPSYSPYAGRDFPDRPLWGDTHLHTTLSFDAGAFGNRLGPEEAYQFARGDEITSTGGYKVRLSRPLDWLAVTDHSDAMGAMNEIIAGNPDLMRDKVLKDWNKRINQGGDAALQATM